MAAGERKREARRGRWGAGDYNTCISQIKATMITIGLAANLVLHPELCELCGVTHGRLAAPVFAVLCSWVVSRTDVSLKQIIK